MRGTTMSLTTVTIPMTSRPKTGRFCSSWTIRPIGTLRLDDLGDGTGAVRLVAITRSEQGKGHGRAMGEMCDAIARSLGMAMLLVNAAPEALAYYERTGWERHVWNPAELVGIAATCIQMRKRL